jgi:7-cyano-7-deazaguanine reductase
MPKRPLRSTRLGYTGGHARAGISAPLPPIETWENQFPRYEITIETPEFTSICPKTGLPDFGVVTLTYMPRGECLELKSYKEYLHAYRNLGIFYENAVNRILADVVRAARPLWAVVRGEFNARGGMRAWAVARFPLPPRRRPAGRPPDA